MKKITQILLLVCFINTNAQIGIGTTNPNSSSVLDIVSIDKGVLLPRLSSIERDNIINPEKALLIFNTDINKFEFNFGNSITPNWKIMLTNEDIVSSDSENLISTGTDGGAYIGNNQFFGKFIITSTGNINITGLPFKPSMIKFIAHANIDIFNIDNDNGVGNNNNGISNSYGTTNGYAIKSGAIINEQCIYIGGNANSINDISRYASDSHCLGLRYSNNNGQSLGKTTAKLVSFNTNGFTLNVDNYADNTVILYEAFK